VVLISKIQVENIRSFREGFREKNACLLQEQSISKLIQLILFKINRIEVQLFPADGKQNKSNKIKFVCTILQQGTSAWGDGGCVRGPSTGLGGTIWMKSVSFSLRAKTLTVGGVSGTTWSGRRVEVCLA
jgi:hypothetical protein